jgi:hypothetical protein
MGYCVLPHLIKENVDLAMFTRSMGEIRRKEVAGEVAVTVAQHIRQAEEYTEDFIIVQ